MNVEAIAAKLAMMQATARVHATANIHYQPSGVDIDCGSRGTIKAVSHGGALVAVLWDGLAEAIWTTYEGVEVLPS